MSTIGESPVKIRVLRISALVLVVAGLFLLYHYSIHRGIPEVRIGDITPAMNFAVVKLRGEVVRDACFFKSGGVAFNLSDGSGEISVNGGRAQADELKRAGKVPRRGDRIEISGSIGISSGQEFCLRLQSAEQLILERKAERLSAAPEMTLSEITAGRRGETVSVRAVLKSIEIPPPGARTPYRLIIGDGGILLPAVFWEDIFQEMKSRLPVPGTELLIHGRVDLYKGGVQIRVDRASGITEIKK